MGAYVLYVHQNKKNGKRYIGITKNPRERWRGNGSRYHECPHFYAAIQKYGWDGFTHEVILTDLSLDEANRLEVEYIERYQTTDRRYGYNICSGGMVPPSSLGRPIRPETRQKLSKALKGKYTGANSPRSKAVRCVTTGEVFESQRIASKLTGAIQSEISRCCTGEIRQTHGLEWEYVED